MRRQLFAISLASILLSPAAIAGTLSADAIKSIHQDMMTQLSTECKTEKLATDDVCDCYGKASAAHIDDTALAKCSDDKSGEDCISKIANDLMKSSRGYFDTCKNGTATSTNTAASTSTNPPASTTSTTTTSTASSTGKTNTTTKTDTSNSSDDDSE